MKRCEFCGVLMFWHRRRKWHCFDIDNFHFRQVTFVASGIVVLPPREGPLTPDVWAQSHGYADYADLFNQRHQRHQGEHQVADTFIFANDTRTDEGDLDAPVNLDPYRDHDGLWTGSTDAPGMTLDDLLGPEVDELIRINKRRTE